MTEIRTLADIVRRWAAESPDRLALTCTGRTVTYRQLHSRSSQLARALMSEGVEPGSHVGYVGKNAIEFYEVWFGAAKAGAAIAPFNWRSPAAELAELISDSRAPVVVVAVEFLEVVRRAQQSARTSFRVVSFDPAADGGDELSAWMGEKDPVDPELTVDSGATALLAYTSGTTGAPKGVQHPHASFLQSFRSLSREPALTWTPDDVVLMAMPNFHIAGSWVTLPALLWGGSIAILPQFDPTAVLQAIERSRVTVSCLVPTAIQALLNHPATRATDFSSLRSLIYAGSPISVEVLSQAIDTFGCEMSQFYGSTEMWIVTLLRPEQHQPTRPHTLASCGSPMAGVQIRIVGPDGEDVPDGSVGELWVRSPTAFAGYYNQPETTAAAMTDGWYRTGDVGRRDAEGLYYVVDRLKDMIITGGENVYSIEVERALGSHPDVSGAAAIGVPDTRWGEAVTAFVTLRSGNTTTADELREFCRELIAAYKIPKSIAIVQELPMTPSGKVRKAALRALAESQRVAASGQATP